MLSYHSLFSCCDLARCYHQLHLKLIIHGLYQMTIVGIQYGQWGIDKYGTSPSRVDTLAFYPARLKALVGEIEDAKQRCLPPHEDVMPAAFVTFTRRKTQVLGQKSLSLVNALA